MDELLRATSKLHEPLKHGLDQSFFASTPTRTRERSERNVAVFIVLVECRC